MGDWSAAAQRDFDTAVPAYLEDEPGCDECGEPIEDHCDDELDEEED